MFLCSSVMFVSVSQRNQLFGSGSSLPLQKSGTGSVMLLWFFCAQPCSHFSRSGVCDGSHIVFLLISASSILPFSPVFTGFPRSQGRYGRQWNLTFDTERRERMNSKKIESGFSTGEGFEQGGKRQNALKSEIRARSQNGSLCLQFLSDRQRQTGERQTKHKTHWRWTHGRVQSLKQDALKKGSFSRQRNIETLSKQLSVSDVRSYIWEWLLAQRDKTREVESDWALHEEEERGQSDSTAWSLLLLKGDIWSKVWTKPSQGTASALPSERFRRSLKLLVKHLEKHTRHTEDETSICRCLDDPPLYNVKNSGRQMMKARIRRMKSFVSAALVIVAPSDHTHRHTRALPSSGGLSHDLWLVVPASFSWNRHIQSHFVRAHRSSREPRQRRLHLMAHSYRRSRRWCDTTHVQYTTSYYTSCCFLTTSEKWTLTEATKCFQPHNVSGFFCGRKVLGWRSVILYNHEIDRLW